jgi:lysophospholipase L1-like esterase
VSFELPATMPNAAPTLAQGALNDSKAGMSRMAERRLPAVAKIGLIRCLCPALTRIGWSTLKTDKTLYLMGYYLDLKWCQREELNLRPKAYESSALPLSYAGKPTNRCDSRNLLALSTYQIPNAVRKCGVGTQCGRKHFLKIIKSDEMRLRRWRIWPMIKTMNPRPIQCFLSGLVIYCAGATARSELVLSNFSAASPIKIMAIGDSITDDCSLNGAWRLYLQPLLDTNGYPFTFVGRNQSTASGSFTKTKHEGYCGAVIAPPGVYGPVHGYNSPDAYLQKIVPDAFTNGTRPDLVLLLIGVNDIGRGRNPYQVATNDMPKLLDLILSNVPNANVILAKVTSLQGANISGLNYAAFYTNISIYNAALQAMVNQRHALGQNVFVADMFSAVDINSMFMSDHVHPNILGLKTMAQEWYTRIQAITITTNRVTTALIHGGEIWKYSDTGQDLGTNWSQPDYDDGGWASGPARLGYGDPAVLTTVSFGPDANNRYVTTYFRHWFYAPINTAITNLNLRLSRVDGAVVWLNGQEVFRINMPAGPIAYTNLASKTTVGESSYIFYPTNLATAGLPAGTNLVAVEVHLRNAAGVACGMDLELLGLGHLLPPPTLTIELTGGNLLLSWPASNSAGFTLYSASNLTTTGSWMMEATSAQTNGGNVIITQSPDAAAKFFRLQQH